MSAGQAVSKDDPLMIAWEAWKASGDYQTTRKWATAFSTLCEPDAVTITHSHLDGALWNVFMRGWKAREANDATDNVPREDQESREQDKTSNDLS